MGYKSIVGAVSDTSVIIKYSDDEQAWKVFTPWKDNNHRLHLHRPLDTIPYADVAAYTTFLEPGNTKVKGGNLTGIIGGMLFGAWGALSGVLLGSRQVQTVHQLGFTIRTVNGNEYAFPLIYAPFKTKTANSSEVKMAIERLQKVVTTLEREGTPVDENWHTNINSWIQQHKQRQ